MSEVQTIVIDNFGGRMTRQNKGDLNSGFVKFGTSNSYDIFSDPKSLKWFENPVQIDSAGAVITDLILDGKVRVESGITYAYCIGHTGRLYKIQVNDPTTFNPDYDNPVLLTTLTSGTPTFTRGSFVEFFGATEQIYVGHDKGVTRVNFDGTGEAQVGVFATYAQNVPRPLKEFVGKLYFGNGSNIGEIDSTATVSTYTKLSPSWPADTQVRDIEPSIDGNYVEMVVNRLALGDITSATPNTTDIANVESYLFKWNGTDNGYTAFNSFPSFNLTTNQNFGTYTYLFGYDTAGHAVFDGNNKVLTPIFSQSPLPTAAASNGNIIGWLCPEFSFQTFTLKLTEFIYGPLDNEFPQDSWQRQFQMSATGSETDVIRSPFLELITNINFGSSSSGYTLSKIGSGKVYFSTLETSASPTTKYKLYKFQTVPLGFGSSITGTYETQNQDFSKKQIIKQIRIYGSPWVAGNSFMISAIGSDYVTPITGTVQVFTAGSNLTIGDDFAWYDPASAPTYSIGIRITNLGAVNNTIRKIEIDIADAGK